MGNETQLFQYRDLSGYPVGPLPLTEIWRFVEAGVLPPNVQITEVGSNDWRPLKSSHAQSNRAFELAKPVPVIINIPPRESSDRSDPPMTDVPDPPEVDLGAFGRELIGDIGKGLWGCVIYPLLLIGSIFISLELIEWLYDQF